MRAMKDQMRRVGERPRDKDRDEAARDDDQVA
jgi:hypothetical protein